MRHTCQNSYFYKTASVAVPDNSPEFEVRSRVILRLAKAPKDLTDADCITLKNARVT